MHIKKLFTQLNTESQQVPHDRKLWPPEWNKIYTKNYSRFPKIALPETLDVVSMPLEKVLTLRQSHRTFSSNSIPLQTIGTILHYTAGLRSGVRSINESDGAQVFDQSRRHYPSAGARYPIELYVGIQHNEEIERGLYYYDIITHSLIKLFGVDEFDTLLANITTGNWVENASLLCMTSAVYTRTTMKYGGAGYNLLLTEAGHMQQNLILTATALGYQSCVVNGVRRQPIEKAYSMDDEEFLLNVIPIGN